MTKIAISAASKVGCVRSNNEDMILVGDTFVRNDYITKEITISDNGRYIAALADGMGGHNCGEVASSDVLHNLQYFYSDMPERLDASAFNEAICHWLESINNYIDSKGRSEQQYANMGTTLVALAIYNGEYHVLNCGDSRLYHYHDGKLYQLTTDHSLNNLMGSSQHSNIITNCIGGGCKTSYIDQHLCTQLVKPGSKFLLCSDGLSDMLPDSVITANLEAGASALDLCNAAEEAGGFDNVSACVIEFLTT